MRICHIMKEKKVRDGSLCCEREEVKVLPVFTQLLLEVGV